MHWVTEGVTQWYREYLYDNEIGQALPYSLQSSKYIEAWLIYRNAYQKFQAQQLEKKSKPDKSSDNLDAMAANLFKQKRGGK